MDKAANPYRGPSVWAWWTWWPYYIRCALWTRWNVVRCPTLSPTYHDPEELILHASMTCLVSFVEYQAGDIDWTWCEQTIHAKAEMDDIYDWWTKRRIVDRERGRALLTEAFDCEQDAKGKMAAFRIVEEANDTDEQVMMHRLVDIRSFLWS